MHSLSTPSWYSYFNSKVVRLKENANIASSMRKINFNSKVVRLKDYLFRKSKRYFKKFQFQSGAVKSRFLDNKLGRTLYFNSKVVRLKERLGCKTIIPQLHFNSKVVRLKVNRTFSTSKLNLYFNSKVVRLKAKVSFGYSEQFRFQFQSGAVKRKCCLCVVSSNSIFQFQSGAVKSRVATWIVLIPIFISIPKWCG